MPHTRHYHRLHMENLEPRLPLTASFSGAMRVEPDPPWHLVNGHVIGIADVDDDGDRDAVARIRDELLWLEFDSAIGDFTNRHSIPDHPELENLFGRFDVLDVDGDGADDVLFRYEIIVYDPYTVTLLFDWFRGISGDAGFAPATQLLMLDGRMFATPQPDDVDGDGDVDFVVTRPAGDGRESVLLLNDTGEFDAPIVLFPHDSEQRVDMENDGDLDFFGCISYCPSSEDLAVWRENLDGVGAVGEPRVIADQRDEFRFVLDGNSRYQFVDLDADGDLDIPGTAYRILDGVSNVTGPDVEGWWENLGAGGFRFLEVALFERPGFGLPLYVDADGDGDEDVVTVQEVLDGMRLVEYRVQWQANPGDGSAFGPPMPFDAFESPSMSPYDSADIDGDGDLDLLFGGDDVFAWYENTDGRGTFARQPRIEGNFRFPEGEVYAADMDGDGDEDLVSSDGGGDREFYLHENVNGRGHFAPRLVILDWSDTPYCAQLLDLADFDGDGDADFLVAPEGLSALGSDRPLQWLGNEGGTLTSVHEVAVRRFTFARSADMDGDADLDLLTSDFRVAGPAPFGSIDWYENTDGNGTFGAVHNVMAELPISLSNLETIDIDGDGHLEVMNQLNGAIFVYRNRRDGTFGQQQRLFDGSKAFGADLDTDGDEDIVARTASGWVWYANVDGMGSLGPSRPLLADRNTPRPADLDYDGDLDLVFPESATWLENIDGRGSFSEERLIHSELSRNPSYLRDSAIVLADLDGDADLDLIAKGERLEFSHPLSEYLVWFRNNAVRPLPGDHNGDGRIDQADLDLVLLNWGRETEPLPDEWFGDPPSGLVSQNELDAVLLNWGVSAPSGKSAVGGTGGWKGSLTAALYTDLGTSPVAP